MRLRRSTWNEADFELPSIRQFLNEASALVPIDNRKPSREGLAARFATNVGKASLQIQD